MKAFLPDKTVERLSQYRRVLYNYQYLDHAYIFSHNLAHIIKTNAANVRRDLMLVGVNGDVHKGYDINELITKISEAIDQDEPEKVAFVGIGELGRTVSEYFSRYNNKLVIAATFRFGQNKQPSYELPSYYISEMPRIIKEMKIRLCVVAVPIEFAKEISTILVHSGVLGILNFSSAYLQLPPHIFVENYDMITKLEKVAYFMNKPTNK